MVRVGCAPTEGAPELSLASPKSRIFAWPRRVMKMFAGLMSRCTMPPAVGRVERIGNFDRQFEQRLGFQRTPAMLVLECQPIQELHRDERLLFVPADFVNGADVGMVQPRGSTRFTAEALEGMRIFGNFRRQELERDEAAQFGIFGLIDYAHPTATEFLDDAIVRNGAADHVQNMLCRQGQGGQ